MVQMRQGNICNVLLDLIIFANIGRTFGRENPQHDLGRGDRTWLSNLNKFLREEVYPDLIRQGTFRLNLIPNSYGSYDDIKSFEARRSKLSKRNNLPHKRSDEPAPLIAQRSSGLKDGKSKLYFYDEKDREYKAVDPVSYIGDLFRKYVGSLGLTTMIKVKGSDEGEEEMKDFDQNLANKLAEDVKVDDEEIGEYEE